MSCLVCELLVLLSFKFMIERENDIKTGLVLKGNLKGLVGRNEMGKGKENVTNNKKILENLENLKFETF